jgi:signal transduction histidine kinase
MLSRLQHSLSAKLILLFICAGAILLLLVGSIMGKGFSSHFRNSIQPFMVHYVELMQHQLGSPPDLEQARKITENIPVDIHVFGPGQNWSTTGELIDRENLIDSFESSATDQIQPGRLQQKFRLKRIDDELILQTRDGDYDIYFQIQHRGDFSRGGPFSMFVLFSILGVLLLMYYATRSLFNPIEDIGEGVRHFGSGDFDHRISKRRNDQLGDLTDSVNRMAEDIRNMLEAKRQMLLGISHELRTPLTRSKINLSLLEKNRETDEINRNIDLMDQLITELLESERLNSPHKVIQPEPTDVRSLVEELVINEFSDFDVDLNLNECQADVDPVRIRLLLRNLIQNAIKYNDASLSRPRVSLELKPDGFVLAVQDFGEGIAAEHVPLLTEPFYRADPARRQQTGGYGLGLYLCKMIVQAHSGKMTITSEQGKGTTIRCSFPQQC